MTVQAKNDIYRITKGKQSVIILTAFHGLKKQNKTKQGMGLSCFVLNFFVCGKK